MATANGYCKNEDEIPHLFDKEDFKLLDVRNIRITHCYDLSKFWLTTKYKELKFFQQYLFKMYYKYGSNYRLSSDDIFIGQYCVVLKDNGYYRGIVVGLVTSHSTRNRVQFLNIDFGIIDYTSIDNLFEMNEDIKKVPRFAIRASLHKVAPHNSNEWTVAHGDKFSELVTQKVLIMRILSIDYQDKVVFVSLWHEGNSIAEMMHQQAFITYAEYPESSKDIHQDKFKYLHPSHEVLESGKVALSISDANYFSLFNINYLLEDAPSE